MNSRPWFSVTDPSRDSNVKKSPPATKSITMNSFLGVWVRASSRAAVSQQTQAVTKHNGSSQSFTPGPHTGRDTSYANNNNTRTWNANFNETMKGWSMVLRMFRSTMVL